jgi:hypothetical protein
MSDTMPFWPRFLTRTMAAKYLGVSVDVFDDEVAAGLWPRPRPRGGKGGRLTWDRVLLDRRADEDAGLSPLTPGQPPSDQADIWAERINGKTTEKRA